jgi:hypothetical protein
MKGRLESMLRYNPLDSVSRPWLAVEKKEECAPADRLMGCDEVNQ